MSNELTPQNIVAAAIISQFMILSILVAASQIMGRLSVLWEPFYRSSVSNRAKSYSALLILLTLVTLGALFFSDVFYDLWAPLLSDTHFPTIKWQTSIKIFVILDILCVSVLVFSSGGPRNSPFASLFALMPVIAIFLRENTTWISIYTFILVITFTASFTATTSNTDFPNYRDPAAFWFVTVATIIVATFIGKITTA